jgi:hypothetical protein
MCADFLRGNFLIHGSPPIRVLNTIENGPDIPMLDDYGITKPLSIFGRCSSIQECACCVRRKGKTANCEEMGNLVGGTTFRCLAEMAISQVSEVFSAPEGIREESKAQKAFSSSAPCLVGLVRSESNT